jgi:carboxyl-terminal processing protease
MTIRSLARIGVLLASALAAAPLASAQVSVWTLAGDGETEQVLEQLQTINDTPEFASLKSTGTALVDAIEAREAKRAEEIDEVEAEMAEHLAEAAETGAVLPLSEALRSAVELQMLTNDLDAFHARADIQRLVQDADAAAQQAEIDHDWLMASELYYRLRVLFEETGRYEEDAQRQARRLAMIRLYTPERFWELRNERRLRDGDDPLPPYNPFGDSWQEKLAGINYRMIHRALSKSADGHVDRVGLRDLMLGGLDAVTTMSKTSDLRAAFPGLADAQAAAEFQGEIAELRRAIELQDRFSGNDLTTVLKKVMSYNEQTVQIPMEPLLHEFGNGAMGALDQFSGIIWPDEIKRFERSTRGSFVGVGIQIELDELQNIRVVTPLEGTPAQRAGVRAGDLIKKVDGDSTVGFTLDQAVEVITGEKNTKVTLTMERGEGEAKEDIDFTITRKTIDLPTVKGWEKTGPADEDWNWFIDREAGIGYLRISSFAENTTDSFDGPSPRCVSRDSTGWCSTCGSTRAGCSTRPISSRTASFQDG